ncbi:glutamate--cysteine ligase [Klugiella xanthotipulae]|uniref:Putative glutamate--cysteine ligase 2 n=1 Tax=Klugiella xanthotipulae TaxID=244735 RepID=A0A543HRV9_9MICO|nr:glutamate--cysteine ligase [Klugiella xanthotipulae]TQM61070.1 carboxylate-amine ligase [Klugiella xanthotipulae]
MNIEFAHSPRSTVGVEWELAMVDRESGELVNIADQVFHELRQADGSKHPSITSELLQNTLELVSGVHTTVAGAVADLQGQLAEVRAVLDPLGVDVMCAGSHPFSQWFNQIVTDTPRYQKFVERTQWWGRNMMIWGIHVHVGIDDREKVFPLLHGLLTYYPHLQALSASSPFWAGEATGYASNRALMFQQIPTAGLPYDLTSWDEFERYIDDLTGTGILTEVNEARWDIRPSPRWGTLEMRACDGLSTAEEIGAVTALIQCLTEKMSSDLDSGIPLPKMQPWFVRENKWRAARFGLDATIIVNPQGEQQPVTLAIRSLVDELSPVAERMGCLAELYQVNTILDTGASYQRQLRIAESTSGDLRAVVSSLAQELRHGLNSPNA